MELYHSKHSYREANGETLSRIRMVQGCLSVHMLSLELCVRIKNTTCSGSIDRMKCGRGIVCLSGGEKRFDQVLDHDDDFVELDAGCIWILLLVGRPELV